jgi:hypothetical protein
VGRYDALREALRTETERLRQLAHREGQHRRTPGIVADLALGLRYFLAYAHEAGALDQAERDALWANWWAALGEAAAAQATHQRAGEPARRFIQLLGAALASGAAHVAGRDGDEPLDPAAWGWRLFTIGTGENEREEWRFQGKRVGWLDDGALYLEPDAALAAAQAVGEDVGDGLTITPQVLRKRLHEQGLLASVDQARETLTVRRKLEGRQRSVLHVHPGALSESWQPDKPDTGMSDGDPVSDSGGEAPPRPGNPTPDPTPESGDFTNESGPSVRFVGSPPGVERRAAQGAARTAPVPGAPENPTSDPTCDPTMPVGAQIRGTRPDEWEEEF